MEVDPQDIDWHDGNLVDVQVSGLLGERQDLILLLDLYAQNNPKDALRRYRCIGAGLTRILIHGDMARLVDNRRSGNIDFMRLHSGDTSEILTISLFGGSIEAEAGRFQLTEVEP